MYKSASISAWSADAFLCLNSSLIDVMSSEYISRIENFIDAYVLYEELLLPERYSKQKEFSQLDPEGKIFKYIKSETLDHSDDMTKHVSIDVGLYESAFEEISKEDRNWFIQHQPSFAEEVAQESDFLESKFMSQLRLWQWGLLNEVAEKNKSIPLFPLSLEGIEKFDLNREKPSELVISRYLDFANFHQKKFLKLIQYGTEPFIARLSKVPPLLSLYIDRTSALENWRDTMITLREEFKEFRSLRERYSQSITEAESLVERQDIVDDWDGKWGALCAGEFKEPSFLSRKLSATDSSSAIVSVESASPKVILKNLIEHTEYRKAYKHFRVFGSLNESLNSMKINQDKLNDVFGVEKFVQYKKI